MKVIGSSSFVKLKFSKNVTKVSRKNARKIFYYFNPMPNQVVLRSNHQKQYESKFFSAMVNHVYFKSFAYKSSDSQFESNKSEYGLTLNGKLLKGTRQIYEKNHYSSYHGVFNPQGKLSIGLTYINEQLKDDIVTTQSYGIYHANCDSLQRGWVDLTIQNRLTNTIERVTRIGEFNEFGKQIKGKKITKNGTRLISRS